MLLVNAGDAYFIKSTNSVIYTYSSVIYKVFIVLHTESFLKLPWSKMYELILFGNIPGAT